MADHARVADGFVSRMVGLLDRDHLAQGEALVITRCQQIHMFFMRFAIDVIFVDRNDKVVGLVERIRPFTMSRIFWQANRALELPAGCISQTHTALGDQLDFLS